MPDSNLNRNASAIVDVEQFDRKITIARMMWWVVLAALACASFSAFPQINRFFKDEIAPTHQAIIVVVAWIVFAHHYFKHRNYTALSIHVIPLLFLAGFIPLLRGGISTNQYIVLLLMTMICSTGISLVLGLEFHISRMVKNGMKLSHYLLYRIVGGAILLAIIFSLGPSLMKGVFDLPAAMMGALIGIWVGLYHALATLKWKFHPRVCGTPTRMVVTLGFIASIAGPFLIQHSNRTISTLPLIPTWLGPLLGFVVAILIILAWRIPSIILRSRKDIGDSGPSGARKVTNIVDAPPKED